MRKLIKTLPALAVIVGYGCTDTATSKQTSSNSDTLNSKWIAWKQVRVDPPKSEIRRLTDSMSRSSEFTAIIRELNTSVGKVTNALAEFPLVNYSADLEFVGGRESIRVPRSFCLDNMGNMWVGTINGIHIKTFDAFSRIIRPQDGLGYNLINAIVHEPNGATWIGYGDGGFAGIHEDSITNFKGDGSAVLCINKCRQREIWLGKYNGLFVYNDSLKSLSHVTTAHGLPGNMVQCIFKDKSGNVWIGTDKGLAKTSVDSNGIQIETIRDSLDVTSKSITGITQDAAGKIWVTTSSSGAVCMGKSSNYYVDKSNGLSNDSLAGIVIGPNNSIIISGTGFIAAGINEDASLFPDMSFKFEENLRWNTRNFVGNTIPNSIARDNTDMIWIATTAGTVIMKINP